MPFIRIERADDPRLDDYRNVPDAELLRAHGVFVAEGRLVVQRLLEAPGFATRSVLVTEAARRAMAGTLARAGDVPVFVVDQPVVNTITGFNMHRGCLAIGERPPAADWQTIARDARLLVALERVANADNVGVVFRNAAAFGADGVLLDETCTDPLYRKAIRTSMGAALRVPFARLSPWPEGLRELHRRGWTVIGLTPSGETTLAELPGRGVPTALVLGHEGEGLSDAALEACTIRARIPMAAGVDSLNVATACAIALYELT